MALATRGEARRSTDVRVRGGAGGVVAHDEQLRGAAHAFGATATSLAGTGMALHAVIADPQAAVTAVLDPIGWTRVEAALLDATDAPGGVLRLAAGCAAVDADLRAAAAAYDATDRLAARVGDAVRGVLDAPGALAAGAVALVRSGRPTAAVGVTLAHDPRLADAVMSAPAVRGLVEVAAHVLPDGRGIAVATGTDGGGVAGRPPRQLSDVLADLARRNRDRRHGEIDVRVLSMPDGSRRAIVDVTGTKSWTPLPTRDVTSLATDARALVGRRGAYEQGVLAAMRDAGVRPGDAVMLVGHSEGGMVAVTAARDALAAGRFRVTHVLTAGSPVGGTVERLPPDVRVLALENDRDVVPHLDGTANPDRPEIVTVGAARGPGDSVAGDHHLETAYLPLVRDAQHGHDPSVRGFLAGARGFFGARSVVTHTYQVQRR